MGINQAVFTSSARGLTKGGGLGIHTYNIECSALELSEFQQSFCSYVYRGSFEEILQLPVKMVYGKVGSMRYMQAEVTYLGLDYDKVSGRMGNYLSHMFSFSKEDMKHYPMQMYGSPDYRTNMMTDEVDGSKKVEYLPTLSVVRPGTFVDIDRIQTFLSEKEERMDFFCHLLAAVIEREQVHKIIIYDKHENIILWIAAIEYALPLRCVRELSFSTYEYNPLISEFDIRGAVPGLSVGNPQDYSAGGQFYVFDGINGEYPKFDIGSDFFQYGIQMAMSYAYDSMEAFYDFLESYEYEAVDQNLYDGFQLFQMVQGGMFSTTKEEFDRAVSFEQKYGSKISCYRMLRSLVKRLKDTPSPQQYIMDQISFLLAGYYGKNLTFKELKGAVIITMGIEMIAKQNLGEDWDGSAMWESLYMEIYDNYPEYMEEFSEQLVQHGQFSVLGDFCIWMLPHMQEGNLIEKVEKLFSMFWSSNQPGNWKSFDMIIEVADQLLEEYEDEEKNAIAMALFLKVQELGKGEIAGCGMEQLIKRIAFSVSLVEDKNKKSNILHRKKSEGDKLELELQTRCAYEVFNYTQKNGVDLPIAKIRINHLKRMIENAYESGKELSKTKSVRFYMEYPIDAEKMDKNELRDFFHQLCKIIFLYNNDKNNFMVLLACWIFDEDGKYMLMSEFVQYEASYMKKEGDAKEFAALLNAAVELQDSEYCKALIKAVADLKSSLRNKITEIMLKSCGTKSQAYLIWKELNRKVDCRLESRSSKKGILGFRKK